MVRKVIALFVARGKPNEFMRNVYGRESFDENKVSNENSTRLTIKVSMCETWSISLNIVSTTESRLLGMPQISIIQNWSSERVTVGNPEQIFHIIATQDV